MINSSYICINTKIKSMSSKILTENDYFSMISKQDLSDLFDFLFHQTHYGKFLEDVPTDHLHRETIERPLDYYKFETIEKILHYLKGPDRTLIQSIFFKNDISILIQFIRYLARGENFDSLHPMLIISKNTKLPIQEMLKAKDWDSFKKTLVHTEFFRILEIFPSIATDRDLFSIEKSLERYYYDEINQLLKKLQSKQNETLIETMRKEIDLANLVWFYRGKKFYQISSEELIAFSLHGGLRIKKDEISEFALAKTVEDFKELVKNPKYKEYWFLFNHQDDLDLYMRRRRERFLYFLYKKLFFADDSGVAKSYAFLRLIEFEISDIIAIIESKRYEIPPDDTKKYLIHHVN